MPVTDKRRADPQLQAVRFLLDGEIVSLTDIDPTRTVLQYLREDLRRTGTKEGCAEGDCGACTVVLAEPDQSGQGLRLRAINSCIQFLPTLHGKQLLTVESLVAADGTLHPVQRALLDCHASQCGFCTPGFVMSLFALYKSQPDATRRDIDVALAGNLCRCTGYRPIVDAANTMYSYAAASETDGDWTHRAGGSAGDQERVICRKLVELADDSTLSLTSGDKRYFAPRDINTLAELVENHPDACILAGGTDVGLWVSKQLRELPTLIYTGDVADLQTVTTDDACLDIGAGVTINDAVPHLLEHYPEYEELFLRFASPPIRNAGTLGGNIANGSPIGDSMPALITLGTRLELRKGKTTRELPLDEFYLAYQETALQPGEFVTRIKIPLPESGREVRSYKISKRFDQDISAVCGAFSVELDGSRVRDIRIAYGGLAATPKRALECEQALLAHDWNEASVQAAMAMLDRDYAPIGDMRASDEYRRKVGKNLLYKFYLETSGTSDVASVYEYAR
ncbi:MAG: xanthine dehydrogenase small subunit [Gammaproteobacteria bacterium]|nr:xanthine dehydrogenase small subunit [Gammaproteobacteria bacterium]